MTSKQLDRALVSRSWRVDKQHRGFFTGGKLSQLDIDGELHLVCWNAEDITVVQLKSGEVVAHIDSEDDGFLAFAVHPSKPVRHYIHYLLSFALLFLSFLWCVVFRSSCLPYISIVCVLFYLFIFISSFFLYSASPNVTSNPLPYPLPDADHHRFQQKWTY